MDPIVKTTQSDFCVCCGRPLVNEDSRRDGSARVEILPDRGVAHEASPEWARVTKG